MAKKVIQQFKTRENNGRRYMICRNSIEDIEHWSWNALKDKPRCNTWSEVGKDAVAVLCYKCTALNVGGPELSQKYVSKGRPRGWQFMSVFVDSEGNVYHKGVEQPELKGTLPLTDTTTITTKKLTKQEKSQLRDNILQDILLVRNAIKNAQTKKEIKSNYVKLNRLERRLKKLR
jgi:hypothetical protein